MGGNEVAHGAFPAATIPIGKNIPLGKIAADLSRLSAPGKYRLVVKVGPALRPPAEASEPNIVTETLQDTQVARPAFENYWNFWLYPAQLEDLKISDVLVTSSWDEAEKELLAGGKVLFQPRLADLAWSSPPLARVPVFWNALMGPTWSRMLGLWCDTNSPALAKFPTESHCDWQWTELVRNARAINLDHLSRELKPIVSAIDDWNRNYKLGVVFEAKVGTGKLLVCSLDLNSQASPVARQLKRSLLDYMAGSRFTPQVALGTEAIPSLLFDNRIMHQLGATATADGRRANELIDGDPNTFWSSADARGNGPKYPHEIKISFPQAVALSGLVLMPRQNHREHQGDLREFTLQSSDDGTNWQPVASGQLASTFDEQKIPFGKTVSAKYLKLTALSGFGNDNSAALAELAVIYAGPKLADDNAGSIEYQRVRTASPDIDAGDAPAGPAKRGTN